MAHYGHIAPPRSSFWTSPPVSSRKKNPRFFRPAGSSVSRSRKAFDICHGRCTFTGKELDAETGYSYFGARYYDPATLTAWLSVDPMADKYPSISPYAYCAWNPLKLVDPDGMDIWKLDNEGQLIWQNKSETDRIIANDGSYVDVNDGVLTKGVSHTKKDGHFLFSFKDNSDNARTVFEFMADNSDVEFSLIGLTDNPSSENANRYYLTTTFDKNGDLYGSIFSCMASEKNSMRSHTHNHPGKGSNVGLNPSSAVNNGILLTNYAGAQRGDDVSFSRYIKNGSPSCTFEIYRNNNGGEYRSYASPDDRYRRSNISKAGGHYVSP